MAKGIIIVDVPENCRDCKFRNLADLCLDELDVIEYRNNKNKPDWCPVRPIPERANHRDYCDNGRYDKGWNDCLNEVFGMEK